MNNGKCAAKNGHGHNVFVFFASRFFHSEQFIHFWKYTKVHILLASLQKMCLAFFFVSWTTFHDCLMFIIYATKWLIVRSGRQLLWNCIRYQQIDFVHFLHHLLWSIKETLHTYHPSWKINVLRPSYLDYHKFGKYDSTSIKFSNLFNSNSDQ